MFHMTSARCPHAQVGADCQFLQVDCMGPPRETLCCGLPDLTWPLPVGDGGANRIGISAQNDHLCRRLLALGRRTPHPAQVGWAATPTGWRRSSWEVDALPTAATLAGVDRRFLSHAHGRRSIPASTPTESPYFPDRLGDETTFSVAGETLSFMHS